MLCFHRNFLAASCEETDPDSEIEPCAKSIHAAAYDSDYPYAFGRAEPQTHYLVSWHVFARCDELNANALSLLESAL